MMGVSETEDVMTIFSSDIKALEDTINIQTKVLHAVEVAQTFAAQMSTSGSVFDALDATVLTIESYLITLRTDLDCAVFDRDHQNRSPARTWLSDVAAEKEDVHHPDTGEVIAQV